MKTYNIGDYVYGTVTGIEKYGIFVVFDDNSSGLVHISEISDGFVRNVSDCATIGEKLMVKIIGRDTNNHYKLSIKELSNKNRNGYEKIRETESGFTNLSLSLDSWIEESLNEIEKKF